MSNNFENNKNVVSTQWLADHIEDPNIRVIEVDVDTSSYEEGHIPGAVGWNWKTQLQDQQQRDVISREEFEELAREAGINNDSHVVLYGDNHNWFATWAAWLFEYYGFDNVSILDGGREKWFAEDRQVTTEVPTPDLGEFTAENPDESVRAYRSDVEETIDDDGKNLVDVRSEAEFTGEKIAPEGMNETAQRGGHIPGAVNVTWKQAIQEDGTFKPVSELKSLYENKGVNPNTETVTYCRIGERSSHTWFVLNNLLGHDRVRNYDGSWTEWGNLVQAPIETGHEEQPATS